MPRACKLTNDVVRQFIKAQLKVEPPPGALHLCGLRGVIPDRSLPAGEVGITLSVNTPNRYNDTILTFGTHLETFLASVDPGITWTMHPSNPAGCAHLMDGVWRYQIGIHKGYPALVEAAPVTVWRDRNKDFQYEPGEKIETSQGFGIHIHKGGSKLEVNDWSAGCQVLYNPKMLAWPRFWNIIKSSGQSHFFY